jgi:cytochrome c551/c552
MTGLVALVVFSGAMALAVMAIWSTVAPQWRRIARLAAGHVEQPFQPLGQLAQAERRIAVRRWAAAPLPAAVRRLRAA